MGLKLGLISNLATPYKSPLDRLRLGGHFDVTLLSCDLGFRKPQPAIYQRMAQDLGLVPEEMVMVGDSPRSDHDGPKGMGMEAVLLCRHGGRPDRSAIEGLRELPGRVRSLMRRKLSDR
jgi:FMN phosphatase YigB (HAD superfamily)